MNTGVSFTMHATLDGIVTRSFSSTNCLMSSRVPLVSAVSIEAAGWFFLVSCSRDTTSPSGDMSVASLRR